jgi:L-threonylcarbamoyladenylate synthase
MLTRLLDAGQAGGIEEAAALLRQGCLVVFPTDTLYGLGVDAFNAVAISELYEAKGRPLDKGVPILLADLAALEQVARAVPPPARTLIDRYWPGPLTLILPKHPALPENISPNENVAVRIPDHPVARAVIRAAGGAVATSSANRSGEEPARDAATALAALKGVVAAVLDGGPAQHGLSSTIVDLTCSPPAILREGPYTSEIRSSLGVSIP